MQAYPSRSYRSAPDEAYDRDDDVPARGATAGLLVVLCLAQIIGIALLYRYFVGTPEGQRLETAALAGNVIGQHRIEDVVRQVLDLISVVSLAAATCAIGFVALVRRRLVLAFSAVLLVGGANVTTQLLKKIVLTRPAYEIAEHGPHVQSLPSGHTTVAASLAVAAVLVVPPSLRAMTALLGGAYAALTGVATLSAGWHRPSDAIAAYLVVGAWAAFCGIVMLGLQSYRARPDLDESHPITGGLLALAGVALVAIGVAALWYTRGHLAVPVAELTRRSLAVSYAGSAAAIAGFACLMVAVVVATVHRVVPRYVRWATRG